MINSILKTCVVSALLQFVLCGEGTFNGDVNIIRIQNNGSQIRTIYLPKHSSTTSSKTLKYYKKSSSPLDGNKFVLVDHFGNHNSHSLKPNQTTQKQTGKNDILSDMKILKYKVKIQKLNSSVVHQEQSSIKRRKKIPSRINNNRPTKKSGIEIKVGADKIAKLLNIFTIVNFTNEHCYTEEGLLGVCYLASECTHLGGVSPGACAQGFGVCCFVLRTCDESSAINNTYVTSSAASQDPDSGVYVCTVTIYKSLPDVTQLRLSFDNFQLAGPVAGDCVVDRFVVTGQNRNHIIPPICGFDTGKHVYIDVDETEGTVSLTLLSSGAHGVPRDLRVRVTQLTRDHPLLAPHNCLQYFTESRGSVESFNYVSNPTSGSTPGYFNNLNYAVCFKKSAGLCGIEYSNAADGGEEYTFDIVNRECGTSTVPGGQAGAESVDCPDDYISTSTIRLCGFKLNDGSSIVDYTRNFPVKDNTNGPLVLRFRTNQNVTGRGFHLDYMLTPCGTSGGPAIPPAATRAPFLT